MKTCFFCETDACTCTDKIFDRYIYLTGLITDLKVFYNRNTLSKSEAATWHKMHDQAKEEQRKVKLLITYEPYTKKYKRKRKAISQ